MSVFAIQTHTRSTLGIAQEEKESPCCKNPVKIIALRHGESTANELGTITSSDAARQATLTKTGITQVEAAAKKLQERLKIDYIFASPLIRTQETAKIAASYFGLEGKVITEVRLKEPFFGKFEGVPYKEYVKFFPKPDDRFVIAPPDGESGKQLYERIAKFLDELAQNHTFHNKTVLLCTHYYPIVHMCDYFKVPRVKEPFEPAGSAEFTLLPSTKTS